MALPYWSIEEFKTKPNNIWPFASVWVATCPRKSCRFRMIVPRSWKKRNTFGTACCPACWKTNRIPGTKIRPLF